MTVVGFDMSECVVPLMNPRYPGIRGNVQGARKVNSPAIKLGIMSVDISIELYQ